MTTLALLMIGSVAFGGSTAMVRVENLSKQQFLELAHMGPDVVEIHGDTLKFVADDDYLDQLRQKGIPFKIEIPDLTGFYKSRYTDVVTMGGFKTLSEIEAFLDDLETSYPETIAKLFPPIGFSVEGRFIWAYRISDNPDVDEEGEPEVLYTSLHHAREPGSSESLLHFMEHLLSNYDTDTEIADIVDNRELYFVPVVNPDGYYYNEVEHPEGGGMWRKNRRDNGDGSYGVDPNRNYGYMWAYDNLGSSDNPSSETYRGISPFSEPEIAAIRDFAQAHEFVIAHNLHTYSDLEIWPISYDRFYSTEEEFFVNLGDSLTQYNGYAPGIGWTLYPTNGDADDWMWGDTISKPRIISLTAEIGGPSDGFWPAPSRIPALVAENVWPNLYLAMIADNPYLIAPPKPPIVPSLDSVGSSYTLEWDHADSINPAVSYRVIEHADRQRVTDDAEVDNGYWQRERMSLSSARAHSGSNSWKAITNNRAHHWLMSTTPYEVTADDSLCFWIWYAIEEDWDYFYVQVSTDGGLKYENLPSDFASETNPYGNNLGNGITGFSGGWVEAKFDLSAYTGQIVSFRLAYFTDSYYTEEGVYIDDIANVQFFGTTSEIASAVTDTFYVFSGKTNDDYWYQVQATDAEGQEGKLSDPAYVHVEQLVSCCVGILGNANGDGTEMVNISDVTYLVDHLFGIPLGPAPPCPEEGNANGDVGEFINISDVSYLVEHLFGVPLGPAPPACP